VRLAVDRAEPHGARVGIHDVDAAERVHRLVHPGTDGLLVGDVERAGGEGGAALAGDEALGLDGFLVQQVTADHEGALGGEPQRGGPALAARGPGDQRHLAFQPVHRAPSRRASETDLTPPCAVMPPSTGISAPLMNDASSDSRNTPSGATSPTEPVRPSGVSLMLASRKAGAAEAVISVSM